jgi:hypothetical protein
MVRARAPARWRAAERRHPTCRERMGSLTLQILQDPIFCLSSAFARTLGRSPMGTPELGHPKVILVEGCPNPGVPLGCPG